MEPYEARPILEEMGVEPGARFHLCDSLSDGPEAVLGEITIKSTEDWKREIDYKVDLDGETHEKSDTVETIAGFFKIGHWRPITE